MNIIRLNNDSPKDKVVVRGSTGGGTNTSAELAKNVTHAELVTLRDNGELVAGQQYRIIDYETTCTWGNTQVAGHPFDLVLTALDNKTLDEKCSAIWSERDIDGYFANSNLAAWDVRYCLDNDTERFDWALAGGYTLKISAFDTEFNTIPYGNYIIGGVNYYMWVTLYDGELAFPVFSENPKPSVQDTVYLSDTGETIDGTATVIGATEQKAGNGVIYRLVDESGNSVPYDFKNIMFSRPLTEGKYDVENGVDTFCYTFSCIDSDIFEIADQSVKEPYNCENNRMGFYSKNNIFLTFIGASCSSNTFGDRCTNNTFGNECNFNIFRNNCYNNTFGDNCNKNTFEVYCYSNTFEKNCDSNIFGNECNFNIFGKYCSSNTFGDRCTNNTFGNNCDNNTFGVHCSSIIFRNNCYSNTFGNECHYNTFGVNKDFFAYSIELKSHVSYITLVNSGTSNRVRNCTIYCISGTSSEKKEIVVEDNGACETFITTKKDGTIIQYTIDDIINA
jgi:hypothetical protein